jgi:hypothetical protein
MTGAVDGVVAARSSSVVRAEGMNRTSPVRRKLKP